MLKPEFFRLLYMEANERILRAITLSGLSNGEVAEACGVKPSAITHWINGSTKNLKPHNLFALADATGFSPRWIGIGEGPERLSDLPGIQLTSQETALLSIYRELPQDRKEIVFGMIRGMQSVYIQAEPKKITRKHRKAND